MFVILNASFFYSVPAAEPSETIVIHAGELLAVPGEPPRQRQSIIIRAGRVEEIRDGFVPAASTGDNDAEIIDLSDHFVMPGFIDLHVHLSGGVGSDRKLGSVTMSDADVALTAAMHARRTLMGGFTTVRDVLASPGVCDGADGCRAAVRRQVKRGADVIKVAAR